MRQVLLGAMGALFLAAGPVMAAPTFQITGGGYTLGDRILGPTCPTRQLNASVCGIGTYTLGSPAAFTIGDGASLDLGFGTFELQDDNDHFHPTGEVNPGLSVYLTFSDPIIGTVVVTALSTSVRGVFSDPAVDQLWEFAPVEVATGDGGVLTIAFDDLSFSDRGQVRSQDVRLTYTQGTVPDAVVPAPASLPLFAAGMGAFALTLRRRKRG